MSSGGNNAVFLSYASQDAEAARRIGEALRAAGVEVWFDQNELVGGDAWDAKIRGQIAGCALFVPIISANTQARTEGYFRLEWKLAAQRTHMIADDAAFLLPVVIDDTRDGDARVPAEFRAVQWTRLAGGEGAGIEKFCARVGTLLAGEIVPESSPVVGDAGSEPRVAARGRLPLRGLLIGIGGLVLAAVAGYLVWPTKPAPSPGRPAAAEVAASGPLTEAQKLTQQARALIEDDPLAVRENYLAAERLCQRAVDLDPADSDAWAVYARAGLRLISEYNDRSANRIEAVQSRVETALRLKPESIEAGLAMAQYEFRSSSSRESQAAIERLQRLAEKAPTDRRVLEWLTRFEFAVRRPERAEEWARRAEDLPGGSASSMLSRARHHMLQNEIIPMHEWIVRAQALRSTTDGYFLELSSWLHVQGDVPAAKQALEKVPLPLLAEDAIAVQAFQVAYWGREFDRAAAQIGRHPREFLEGNNIFYPKAYLVGEALHMAGKVRAAETQFRSALQAVDRRLATEPNRSRLVVWKSKILARLGSFDEAARTAETATELGVEFARWSALWRAEVAVLLEKRDEAIAACTKAMEGTAYRPYTLSQLRFDPVFDPLRNTPAFQAVIARGIEWLDEMKRVGRRGSESFVSGVPTIAPEKSVAVLAFANLSDDKANEYFSDGISEELLNVLAKVPGLKVSARTSAFSFKGKNTPVPEIAKQLGVAYVVEGSVRKGGDKVRITAQLIKAADGFHVWSDTFTRELKDIFAVQDEIAGLIAKSLSLKLGASSAAAKAAVPPQAFELYVQARQAWNLRTDEANDRAERLLMRVLELAPEFARAHAALADVWLMRLGFGGLPATGEAMAATEKARIRSRIDRALALDPESAEAHASLGLWHLSYDREAEAEPALRQAVALNPNYASAQQWLARALIGNGHMDEALQRSRLAVELDPLVAILWDQYGRWLFFAGRDEAAIAAFDRAVAVQPDYFYVLARKADVLAQSGRAREAVALVGNLPSTYEAAASIRFNVYALAGLTAEAEAVLATIPPSDPFGGYRAAGLIALGRSEDALAAVTSSRMTWSFRNGLIWSLTFDPLRRDPRWVKFLAEAGLTEAHERAQAWRKAHPPEKPAAKK